MNYNNSVAYTYLFAPLFRNELYIIRGKKGVNN